jgi:cytochrome P450
MENVTIGLIWESFVGEEDSRVDFFMPEILGRPYEFYKRARIQEPVYKLSYGSRTVWMVLPYDLVKRACEHPELFSNDVGAFITEGSGTNPQVTEILANGPFGPVTTTVLLASDDPLHKRYRSLVNTAFSPPRVAKLTEAIDRLVDELIDGFIERGECNFTNQFAVPLPIYFTAQILGFERNLNSKIREWSDAALTLVGKMGSPQEEVDAAKLVVEFQHELLKHIRSRRKTPLEDLTSYLVQAEVPGEAPLSDAEIVPLLYEIMIAGNETTRNTMIGAMVLLHQHPEQLQALRENSALAANAVDELLRFITPLSALWRRATRDQEFGGASIKAGEFVLLRFESANHDEKQFADPDRFDIGRANARTHLAFGFGLHHCLGHALARRQLVLTLPKLAKRLRNSRLDLQKSDLERKPSLIMHALGDVHLKFDPASKSVLTKAVVA